MQTGRMDPPYRCVVGGSAHATPSAGGTRAYEIEDALRLITDLLKLADDVGDAALMRS
jgi:hypothetical protein